MPTTIDNSATLLTQLGQLRLLPSTSLAELSTAFPGSDNDVRSLARHLIGQGWLTPYQINQLFAGRGSDLVLGTYVILERLGEGGMAQVFKARHQRLDRLVALKIVRPDLVKNAEAVRRFRREVRAAAQLNHPNIVLALDADEVNGTHFMVMEFADGIDLSRLVKQQGPLGIPQACDYARQVALGLQHAHERGLVHRDIKPSNLLVMSAPRSDENQTSSRFPWGLVKILDMGLARCLREDQAGDNSALTRAGELIGTPEYLAPEQAANPHGADIRADLYSLGCTLYFLLTGKPPFNTGSAIEKLFQHRLEEARPVEQLRPDVPPELGGLMRKLMAKQPTDRFAEPQNLAVALLPFVTPGALPRATAAVATVPMVTSAAPTPTAFEKPPAIADPSYRRRFALPSFLRSFWATGLSALVLLFLLGGFFTLLSWKSTTPTEKEEADTPEKRVRLELRRLIERAEQPSSDLKQLRRELLTFRAQHATPDVVRTVNELLPQFPSPLDGLDPKKVPSDVRLGNYTGADLVYVQGDNRLRHGSAVQSVALSPDGKWMVSGGDNRHLCFWDSGSGKRLAVVEGGNAQVMAVACSPDGQTAASACMDGTVRLWDVNQRKERNLLRHPAAVRSIAFSHDSRFLATASHGQPGKHGAIRVWEVAGAKELFALEGHHGAVMAVAFSPDSKLLASGGEDKSVRLWDVAQRKEIANLGGHQHHVGTLAFSSNGQVLASGSLDKTFHLWDVGQRKERPGAHDFGHAVAGLAFVPNGPLLLVACHDGAVHLWDIDANQEKGALRGHHGGVLSVAVRSDGQMALSGGHDGSLRRWDLSKQQDIPLERGGPFYTAVALSGDDQTLATAQWGARIRLVDVPSLQTVDLPDRHQFGVGSLTFAPDGKTLLSGGWDHNAILWDLPTRSDRFTLRGHHGNIAGGAFSASAPLVATASHDGTAKLWEVGTGKEKGELKGHGGPVVSVAFAPDGKTVATGSHDRTLRLWDPSTFKDRASLDFNGEALAFAPEKHLAAGSNPAAVRLWDASVSRPSDSKLFAGAPLGWVRSLAFSPDGRSFVAGGGDGLVVFWNVTPSREVRRWSFPAAITAMTYAADGRHLVCLFSDGMIAVFRLAPVPERRPRWNG